MNKQEEMKEVISSISFKAVEGDIHKLQGSKLTLDIVWDSDVELVVSGRVLQGSEWKLNVVFDWTNDNWTLDGQLSPNMDEH